MLFNTTMIGSGTAPSMDEIEGYEAMTHNTSIIPAPPIEISSPRDDSPHDSPSSTDVSEPTKKPSFSNYPKLTPDEARKALLNFTAEHCCYGKKAARDMTIVNIEYSVTAQYTLQTFGEKRQLFWEFEPYVGQPIDSPWKQVPPGPWEIPLPEPPFFKETIAKLEIPHTASVKPCIDCLATGKQRCPICFGFGKIICSFCSGAGHDIFETCSVCHGAGIQRCNNCSGFGLMACRRCAGKKHVKCYIQLTCYWNNHINESILDSAFIPKHLTRGLTSQVIFEEDSQLVSPIDNFPDEGVNEASAQLIEQHSDFSTTEKIIRQRHKIRVIPVAKVHYSWKSKTDHFIVYGSENIVYAPDYPQKYCWGCSVL